MSRLALLALRDSRQPIRAETLRLWGVLIREVITAPDGAAALETKKVAKKVAVRRCGS